MRTRRCPLRDESANYQFTRAWAIALVLVISSCTPYKSEVGETLEWMDNTYNPREGTSAAYGNGKVGWNAPTESTKGEFAGVERLASGLIETFTYKGCRITLRVEDDRASLAHNDVYGTTNYAFELKDIDPQSVKITTLSHEGGFECDNYQGVLREYVNCDHAEIAFSTRLAAPLIDEDRHTVFAKLTGADHESNFKSKGTSGFFGVDDIEYAGRLANAFAHAVQLAGGRSLPF